MYPTNVQIKDGSIGLSSHHGIHGLGNSDVIISNVNVADFDVAGIQCNECSEVTISDCIVGPQNQDIPVLGRYTHARAYVPRLKQLMDEYGTEEITFYNREPTTVGDLIDRMINQMDMIYFHVINGVDYDEDDEEWIAAQKLFYNPSGWMDGGSSYGIAFGGMGAQVVGIGSRTLHTVSITLSNIEIFGIANKAVEKIKFSTDQGSTRLVMFDAIDWAAVTDQIEDKSTSQYIGDAYTDLTFAVGQYMESWYFLNSLLIDDSEKQFVFNGDTDAFQLVWKDPTEERGGFFNGCGTDIQLHSSKGAIGLRVDGVQDFNVDNVYIHDVYNWADLGNEEWCGPYPGPSVGDEDIDIQYGYTATRSHGMIMDYVQGVVINVNIDNVESYYGEANGMTIYKGCDIEIDNIQVDNIHAGSQLTDEQVETLNTPNLVPRACGVDIRPDTIANVDENIGIINGENIIGFETCYDQDSVTKSDLFVNGENKIEYYMQSRMAVILMLSVIIGCWICWRGCYNNDGYQVIADGKKEEYMPLL